ncbi:MAG: cupin domain-containing protein [Pseudomonadota bacterium]
MTTPATISSAIPPVIPLAARLGSFDDHWHPRIVGKYNDSELRVAKLLGDFDWHAHAETDELFLVVSGTLTIEFRDGARTLRQGEAIVIPRGTDHRPRAATECHVLLMDRAGEPNTGTNPVSDRTRHQLETIE